MRDLLITLFSPPSLSEREGGVEKRVISKWGEKEGGERGQEGKTPPLSLTSFKHIY